eukprot:13152358-Heterocapsa_arctica.AAC.1
MIPPSVPLHSDDWLTVFSPPENSFRRNAALGLGVSPTSKTVIIIPTDMNVMSHLFWPNDLSAFLPSG